MSLAIVYSRASFGVDAPLVSVEVHLSPGLAGFNIVGLPETAVKESKDRVRSALINANLEMPARKIIVNLAPADLPKEGGRFDLPIAIGILLASGQLPMERAKKYEFVGELALSGELRAVRGILSVAIAVQKQGRGLILPEQNSEEAALVEQGNNLSANHLLDVCAFLNGRQELKACSINAKSHCQYSNDLQEVKGQMQAKRALEIAAAGGHSIIFLGPPGTGKTMLATRLPTILPPLDKSRALEVAALASISRFGFNAENWQQIPFRSPHHTSSAAALVGGGRPPKPGEISLSHHGVLFMDELPEYHRHVLECLREPLESGHITISRAASQAVFPAKFQFVAAMNPCPCGYAGSKLRECRCNPEQVTRYINKLSGPLLDRIDMQVELLPLTPGILAKLSKDQSESSEVVRKRVVVARNIQKQRQCKNNAALNVKEIEQYANASKNSLKLLEEIMQSFGLSARMYHRIIKVARTIADVSGQATIEENHISEAFGYRRLDKLKNF